MASKGEGGAGVKGAGPSASMAVDGRKKKDEEEEEEEEEEKRKQGRE